MKGIDGKFSPYALHWNGTDFVEQNEFADCNCGLNTVLVISNDDAFLRRWWLRPGGDGLSLGWLEWTSVMLPGAGSFIPSVQAIDGGHLGG